MTADCPSRRKALPPRIRTFDEFLSDYTITPQERRELVYHLAAFRARKTIEALLPETQPSNAI